MKIPKKLPSRSSLLAYTLALTLGLTTTALATINSGYDVGKWCADAWGDGTSNWAKCEIEQCKILHPNWATTDSAGFTACMTKADEWNTAPDSPYTPTTS